MFLRTEWRKEWGGREEGEREGGRLEEEGVREVARLPAELELNFYRV